MSYKAAGVPGDIMAGLEAINPPVDVDENNGIATLAARVCKAADLIRVHLSRNCYCRYDLVGTTDVCGYCNERY